VSLSWLDRLSLYLHPRRVVLERRAWRGASRRQVAEVDVPAAGEVDWAPALAAAAGLLAARAGRGASLQVVVADPFVRYAVLPWSEQACSRSARLAVARALLRNVLGDRAAGLDIALDRPAYGRNGLAAGLDSGLTTGLRALARQHRLHLSSLQPRLVAELARCPKALDDGWLACTEAGWLTLAALRGGDLVSLRNHRVAGEPQAAAAELGGLLMAGGEAVRRLHLVGEGALPPLETGWESTRGPAWGEVAHA
jgi:hypothetical protein